jgi:hypothetical protein
MEELVFCRGCKYLGPVMIPWDQQYRRYFCMLMEQHVTDFVTGEDFKSLVLCSSINTDGKCPHFKAGKPERLEWKPE